MFTNSWSAIPTLVDPLETRLGQAAPGTFAVARS